MEYSYISISWSSISSDVSVPASMDKIYGELEYFAMHFRVYSGLLWHCSVEPQDLQSPYTPPMLQIIAL